LNSFHGVAASPAEHVRLIPIPASYHGKKECASGNLCSPPAARRRQRIAYANELESQNTEAAENDLIPFGIGG
jgi:hypothetical protein